MAERVAGTGAATAALRSLCRIARQEFGLRSLTAAVGDENLASRRVLAKAGFVYVAPTEVGGRPGGSFACTLG